MAKVNKSLYTGLLLLLVIIATSCNRKTDLYEVSGTLSDVKGGYFFMKHEVGDSTFIDTVYIDSKGKFSFKGKVDTLTVMHLYFNENSKYTFLLVDKGWNVEMKGDVLYPDLINVKGGNVNDDLTDFKNKNEDLLKSRTDILNSAEKIVRDNDSVPVKDYVVELKNINFELSNIAAAYVKANPDKIASVMLINLFFKDETSIPRLEENLGLLKGRAVDFPLTTELKEFKDKVKMSAVGSHAPYFSIKNMKGKNVQPSDFRGKYLLLTFAGTTCDVCREEKKEAVTIYNELKKQKKNIEFVTIVKDSEQTPLSANIADSVKWDILPVSGGWSAKVFSTYYIREIPYNILISPTGYIIERDLHILALPQKLEEVMNEVKK